MSTAQNIRRAWLSEKLASSEKDYGTDAKLVSAGAALFSVTEQTMRKDLNAVYERWAEIDLENAPFHKAKFMELGMEILQDCREAGAKSLNYSSTVAQFKTLAQIAGILAENSKAQSQDMGSNQSQPSNQIIQSRIEKLRNDPKIRERALKLGLDLDDPDLLASQDVSSTLE